MGSLNPYTDFGLANVLVPGSNKGTILYVDTAANGADDDNTGTRIGEAKLTISGALDACTDYMWDTIIVLNYTSSSEITWPIAMDVDGVRLIAAPGGGWQPRYTGGAVIDAVSQGDTDCIHMDADHIHISGFDFRAGASCAGIKFDSTHSRHGIYNCMFNSGAYGVWASTNGAPSNGLTVENCVFISNVTSDGILYASNGPFPRFVNNVFLGVGGIAINVTAPCGGLMILNNRIACASTTAGKAIAITHQECYGGVISDNQANYDAADMDSNPFLDSSAPSAAQYHNSWLLNYRGMTPIHPSVE